MKYIDSKELIDKINKLRSESCISESDDYYEYAKSEILDIIASLQQEQPKVQNGKLVFPKYLYARTKDNKTIDMSYAPQDMTAVEYIRNDLVQQEQPEVDLEREIIKYKVPFSDDREYLNEQTLDAIARHFYELGRNARKEE